MKYSAQFVWSANMTTAKYRMPRINSRWHKKTWYFTRPEDDPWNDECQHIHDDTTTIKCTWLWQRGQALSSWEAHLTVLFALQLPVIPVTMVFGSSILPIALSLNPADDRYRRLHFHLVNQSTNYQLSHKNIFRNISVYFNAYFMALRCPLLWCIALTSFTSSIINAYMLLFTYSLLLFMSLRKYKERFSNFFHSFPPSSACDRLVRRSRLNITVVPWLLFYYKEEFYCFYP